MTIAVTGHTGFIGQYLVSALKNEGISIIGLARSNGIDITRPNAFDGIGHFDVLIHLAGQSFVPLSFKTPALFYNDNFIGTLHCLEACREKNAKIIFLSSYVYGQPQHLPISETHPISPTNPYMSSKYLSEQLCQSYYRDFNVPVCIIRPFNVYGKGQGDHFLIPTIVNQLPTGQVKLQDPTPRRDFIHVMDLVDAIIKLIDFKSHHSIYNIGSGVSTSIGDIIAVLKSNLFIGEKQVFFSNEKRANEVNETRADISKAWEDIKWQPKRIFEDELVEIASDTMINKHSV